MSFLFFFFNDTATTEIYTLSLHDALPIFLDARVLLRSPGADPTHQQLQVFDRADQRALELRLPCCRALRRSEEHTSELQSRLHLVCRLLLEKKKQIIV